MNGHPQVLLIGNGLNRAFGGVSWDELLSDISVRSEIDVKELKAPEPLRAIIVTNNAIGDAMKNKQSDMLGEIKTQAQRDALNRILSVDFDHILTTNYGYELEAAACEKKKFSVADAKKHMRHTDKVTRADNRFLLHTYEEVGGRKIWHIHGEARKPDSMILGHYYYGNLLCRIKAHLSERKDSYLKQQVEGKHAEIKSWVDAFILGDVYILGFGFGFSEFDLWWLLNRKKREKADKGGVYFYEPRPSIFSERIDLLKLFDVEPVDCGFSKTVNEKGEDKFCGSYADFYNAAIEDIRSRVSANKQKELSYV